MSSSDERFRNRAGSARTAAVIKHAGGVATPKASFSRPVGALVYAAGQVILPAVAQPMTFVAAREFATSLRIVRARLRKSTAPLVGAAFALHLYTEKPTVVGTDGSALVTDKSAAYLGLIDLPSLRAFSDGAMGAGIPTVGSAIGVDLPPDKREVYGLLEARGPYAAGDAELFEVTLEVLQD